MATLKVTLVKSTISSTPYQKKVVEALGLTKIGRTVELPDTPQTLGAINKVSHLVKVEK